MLNRLRSQLMLVIMLVAVLPLAVLGIFLTINTRNIQRDAALDLQTETAHRLAQEIETFFTDRPRELRLITKVRGLAELPLAEQREILSEMLAFDEFFEELVLLDAQGQEVLRESKRQVGTTTLSNRADTDEYRVPALEGEVYYSPVQINEETGELLMTISIPLTDLRSGRLVNVLVGNFRLRSVTELLQAEDFHPGEDIYVVSAGQGHQDATGPEMHYELVVAHENPSIALSNTLFETHDQGDAAVGLHGDEVILGLSRFTVGDQEFTVVAELTTTEAYRESNETMITIAGMLVGVLLLAAALGFYFSQRIARPVVDLSTVAERVRSGELNVEADVRGSREIVTLSSAFNAMTAQLRNIILSLEDRVQARTQDLFLTLEVGQLAARIYQQAELLPRVVEFIRERFDLYYTQIYLVDEAGRYAYLEAGTGEVGRQLLDRRHRLDLSETSIVARTVQAQRPVLVADTEASDIHRPNPLLPETRSEVAIPLIVGDQILGVLDLQARGADTFREDNLPVFEALANQLASALRSAQAYEETRIAVDRADEINRRLTGEAWAGYLGRLTREHPVGYRYDLQDLQPIEQSLTDEGRGNGHCVRQPVLLRDEPIGTIQLVEETDREWSADDMALVEAVADRVALALEQFRAFDETQVALTETATQAQRLSLLNELAAEISAAETLTDVYRIVAARTDEVLVSDRASIAMLTPDETHFEIFGLDGEKGTTPVGAQLSRHGTWLNEVLTSRHARSLSDMSNVPYPDAQELAQQGLYSSMDAPLIVRGRAIGALNVARREVGAYNQRDENLLTQIASLLSAQIENRGLLEQAQKRAAEMQAVAEVGTEVSRALDPEQLLWTVSNLAKARFNLYHAHIYLTDNTGERLVLAAGAGEAGQRMVAQRRGIPLSHEHSLVARSARMRAGVIVNDVTLAPDFLPNPMLPHTRAELAVPLIAGDQILGVLDVQSDEVGRFDDEDLRVMGTLAAQIAIAVENARLFAEAQQRLAIIESSDDLISLSDLQANLIFMNPAGVQLLGYESLGEFEADRVSIADIHPPEGLERVQTVGLPEALEGGGLWRGENVVLHRDGTHIPVEQTIFALYDEEGSPRHLATIMTDIRERKIAQEELDRERRTLETVLANLPVGVFMADAATGSSLLANDAALEMLGRGLDPRSATSQWAEVYDAYKTGTNDLYPVEQMPLVRGMSGDSAQIDDMEIRRPDGQRVLLEVSGAPITDAEGKVTASVAVFSDITERRRAEEERQQFLIETQARYEAGRQLVAASNYTELLRAIARYSFRDGAVLGRLLTVELDERGEPEWVEITADAHAHDQVTGISALGSRFYLPDLPFSRLWFADPERPLLVSDIDTDERVDSQIRAMLQEGGQHALAVIPLTLAGQWIGLSIFTWEQAHQFTDSEERFYSAMAGQMASVMQSMRLLELTERRAAEMQTVAEVGAEATASLDPDELLWTISALTKEQFGLYHAHIYVLEDEGQTLRLAAGAGEVGRAMVAAGHRIRISHERSLVSRAARSREGVIVNDVTQAEDFLPNPMLPDTRSEMAIPMLVGDQVIGVLDVQSDRSGRFTAEDVQVQSILASQLAIAIQNARQFELTQLRVRDLQIINQVAEQVRAGRDLETMLETITGMMVAAFGADNGGISILHHDEGIWRGLVAAGQGLTTEVMKTLVDDAETYPNGIEAARTGDIVAVNNVARYPGFPQHITDLIGIKSVMALPLFSDDSTTAVLFLNYTTAYHTFTPDEVNLAHGLANQIAVGVERRRAERERIERENLLRTIIDSTPDWIFVKDRDFRFELVNKGMADALGVKGEDLLGKDDYDLGFPEHLILGDPDQGIEGFRPMDQRVINGEIVNIPYDPVMYADGQVHILDTIKTPLRDVEGNVISLLGVGHDVTERERLLHDLQNTSNALAERLKELAALQDVGAYGEENLALEEYLTRVANRIPASMEFPDICASVIEYGGEIYGDRRALTAPVSLANNLEIGSEVYGQLVVGYIEEREFQAEAVPHLRDIAGRVSNYLENRQLFEQTQQALSETELLYNASRRIVDASTIQELIAAVAEAVSIREMNRAVLFSLETDADNQITTVSSIGNWYSGAGPEPSEVGRVYEAEHFPVVRLLQSDEPLFVTDTQTDKRIDDAMREVLSRQGVASLISLPLWVGRRQVGTLLLETHEQHAFTLDEIRPFEALAGQMASALDSLLLLDQTQRRAAEMQAVSEVGAEAASSLDPDRLLKTVSELTKERFGLYHAHVYLMDSQGRYLVLHAGSGSAGDMMTRGGHRIPLEHEKSLVVQAARTQRPVIANNVTQERDFLPNPMLPHTKSELAVPMIAGGEVIGVLDVQADQADFFGPEDVQVQMTLASQVAVAVQNARLFSEQVAVTDQLREVDRLKSEFLASMSHELRTPLNSIIGYAEVLLDGIDGELTNDMQEDVGAIHGSGKHLLNLINDILDLAKIEAGQMDLVIEGFDLAPVAEDMANSNRILLRDKPVEIILDIPEDLPQICADSLRIRQVVSNLLTNAIKFTEEGRITLRARPSAKDPSMVEVSITDTGMGMNQQQLQVIFDRFRQVDQSHTRRAGGTGLGLSITRQLIEMHGGEIEVQSEPGAGSVFVFTLPFVTPESE